MLALGALFSLEALVATMMNDGESVAPAQAWLTEAVRQNGPVTARCLIGFSALFATFAFLRYQPALERISRRLNSVPINWVLLTAHTVAFGLFSALSAEVYGAGWPPAVSNWLSAAWIAAAGASMICGGLAFLPWSSYVEVVRGTGRLWAYAAAAGLGAGSAASLLRPLWGPARQTTFALVKIMLRWFTSDVVVEPATFSIGTGRFAVVIADTCSGLEGIGLFLVFGAVWLMLFREEVRFPHALILFPAGMAALFLLNTVRITALILIGDAGAHNIAQGGFHSQAGWMSFCVVAFGLCAAARHISWISIRQPELTVVGSGERDGTTALLLPFLAILAAGMVSRAASGGFEWLYPIRLLAAGYALWMFRRTYKTLDWGFGWLAVVTGAVVFGLWIGLDGMLGLRHTIAQPLTLSQSALWFRIGWLSLRVLTAVLVVPVAEELTFRGYILRTLVKAKGISSRFNWIAIGICSGLFGALHGERWLAGIIAGILYGLVFLRRQRIGDAVIAHAVTNGLLTAYVIMYGQWQFW